MTIKDSVFAERRGWGESAGTCRGKGAFGIALQSGLRDNEGKPHLIVVVEDALESSPRISVTDLGAFFLAPLMLKLRRRRERREFPRGSFMVLDKLDLNLKFMFGVD